MTSNDRHSARQMVEWTELAKTVLDIEGKEETVTHCLFLLVNGFSERTRRHARRQMAALIAVMYCPWLTEAFLIFSIYSRDSDFRAYSVCPQPRPCLGEKPHNELCRSFPKTEAPLLVRLARLLVCVQLSGALFID
jgi:hypothetical protein